MARTRFPDAPTCAGFASAARRTGATFLAGKMRALARNNTAADPPPFGKMVWGAYICGWRRRSMRRRPVLRYASHYDWGFRHLHLGTGKGAYKAAILRPISKAA